MLLLFCQRVVLRTFMGDSCVPDNLLDAEVARVNEHDCSLCSSDPAILEQLKIVLFAVRKIYCKDL